MTLCMFKLGCISYDILLGEDFFRFVEAVDGNHHKIKEERGQLS